MEATTPNDRPIDLMELEAHGYTIVSVDYLDRLHNLVSAAQWLVSIWADNVSIQQGSALWEDIQLLRQKLEGVASQPADGLDG